MAPSLSILTPLAPALDANLLSAPQSHCLKRHRGALAPSGAPVVPFVTAVSTIICTDPGSNTSARQWTGAPIRAIVPLPRRCRRGTLGPSLVANGTNIQVAKNAFGQPTGSTNTYACHIWDDDEEEEGELDHEDDTVDSLGQLELDQAMDDVDMDVELAEGRHGDDEDQMRSRCCSYESITAAEGLTAWSFEELRAECYAQSLIARGSRPPPVVHPALAIPPAFAPRILLRIQPRYSRTLASQSAS